MNALKIFSENYVNGDCGITFSSGIATGAYLYDQKRATQWISSGSNDATAESIAITFKNWQGSTVTRTFDRIVLLGHNIKSAAFDYWDSGTSAWVEITAAAMSDVDDSDTLIELASTVSTTQVRVRPATTQSANAEKYIGELKICQKIIDGTQLWRSELYRNDSQKSGAYRTGEGALVFWREWAKFCISGTLFDVSQTDHDLLWPYLSAGTFLTVVLWDDFDLTECFEVAPTGSPAHRLDRKSRLYEIDLSLEER